MSKKNDLEIKEEVQVEEVKEEVKSLSIPAENPLAIYDDNYKKVITQIINEMQDGVDYASLGNGKKKSLLIPGADKFCFRFSLECKWVKDTETLEMTDLKNVIAFRCLLVDRKTKEIVGEGRGSAQIGENQNCKSINSTVKMAEIRAKRDAVLNLFPLRDRFTQDMEDQAVKEVKAKIVVSNGEAEVL